MNSFIKFFAVLGCVCIAQSGFAQFQKGSVLLGGGIYFYNDNYRNNNNYASGQGDFSNSASIGVYPNVGYTFEDNWVVFFETGYRNSSQTREEFRTGNSDFKNIYKTEAYNIPTNIGVKRFLPLGNKFSLGLGAAAGLAVGQETTVGEYFPVQANTKTTNTSKNLNWSVGLSPSINYMLGDKVNLSLSIGSLGYYRSNNKIAYEREGSTDISFSEQNRGNFYSSLSLNNIQIGAYYILPPKTKKKE